MSDILIGTFGYDYPEWNGVFYPKNLARKDFLSYYATKFNAVELNNTFYNMPTAERMLSFYERSEGRLLFSVKANRLLTHEIDGICIRVNGFIVNLTDFLFSLDILQWEISKFVV